jgi:hypothetical protein
MSSTTSPQSSLMREALTDDFQIYLDLPYDMQASSAVGE